MTPHDRALDDVKLTAKALQNMTASVSYFERMATERDPLLLSSLFCSAVVRYARPFSQPPAGKGNRAYPLKQLKRRDDFRTDVHDHLMGIRNTLVAHDDMESIEPRVLSTSITSSDPEIFLVTSIVVSNKCLAYPVSGSTAAVMLAQATACVAGMTLALQSALDRAREEAHRDPAAARAEPKFQESGTATVSEGQPAFVPDHALHPWLTPQNPDFSNVHNGFVYDEFRHAKTYFGTHRMTFTDGTWTDLDIKPPPSAN